MCQSTPLKQTCIQLEEFMSTYWLYLKWHRLDWCTPEDYEAFQRDIKLTPTHPSWRLSFNYHQVLIHCVSYTVALLGSSHWYLSYYWFFKCEVVFFFFFFSCYTEKWSWVLCYENVLCHPTLDSLDDITGGTNHVQQISNLRTIYSWTKFGICHIWGLPIFWQKGQEYNLDYFCCKKVRAIMFAHPLWWPVKMFRKR